MSDNPNYSLKDKSSWGSNVWHPLNNENYYYGIFSLFYARIFSYFLVHITSERGLDLQKSKFVV